MNWFNPRRDWPVLRDHFLRPGLAAALPWPLGFQLLKRWAHRPSPHDPRHRQAYQQALRFFPQLDEAAFVYRRRLLRLVEETDLFLSKTRSERWLKRYVNRDGVAWPTDRPCMIIDMHWGAGHWLLRDIHAAGIEHAGIARNPTRQETENLSPLQRMHGHMRMQDLRNNSHTQVMLHPSEDFSRLFRHALRLKRSLVYLFDVPPAPGTPVLRARMFDRPAQFPRGMLRTAVKQGYPVYAVWTGVDLETGQRRLTAHGPLPDQSTAHLMHALASLLQQAIEQDPAQWHMWNALRAFIPSAFADQAKQKTQG